jgi:hypothetical protein
MNGSYGVPDSDMRYWAGYQVAGSRCSTPPQVAYRLEALQKPLARLSPFQSTTVPQPIAGRHMTPLHRLGRFTTRTVQARSDVEGTWTGRRDGLDVRLVTIGHDLVWHHPGALNGLAKEGLRTGGVAVLAKEHIHDDAVLINSAIQIALLSLAKQERLVYEPPLADRRAPVTHLGRQLWPEGLHPIEDRAVGHVDAALSQ